MSQDFALELLEDTQLLSSLECWSPEVYRDLLAVQKGQCPASDFEAKYRYETAILVLDLTGFTENAMSHGEVESFLRILNAHKVCLPILRDHGATLVRGFADDLVALFAEPSEALDAAFVMHEKNAAFQREVLHTPQPADACVGIGFGSVFRIGPNYAMGDEMNRASRLGEDIARAGETLITEGVHARIESRCDLRCLPQGGDDVLFPYYRVERA